MALLHLPHTAGCLVCGPLNPHGLHLSLFVDESSGVVHTQYTPAAEQIGFTGVVHGGALAAAFDEAMVWAATWAGKRFCLCGELTVRYRTPATVGSPLDIVARVESARPRLIQTTAEARDSAGTVIARASAKYVPLPVDQNAAFVATLLDDPDTAVTAAALRAAADQ